MTIPSESTASARTAEPRRPLWHRLLGKLGVAAFFGGLLVLFGLAAYLSFNLFVTSGATRAPDLTGMPLAEARGLAVDRGLDLEVLPRGQYDDRVPTDHVLRQSPRSGTLVKRGSTLTLIRSLGPRKIEVPSLRGQGAQSASVLLAAAGLSMGRTVGVIAEEGAAGTVVGQDPPEGTAVSPNRPVDVLVALPEATESFVMPDLVYRDYGQVRRFFEGRGIRFGNVKFERYDGVPEGVILRQFPLAGHPLSRDETVSLVIAASPDGEVSRYGTAADAARGSAGSTRAAASLLLGGIDGEPPAAAGAPTVLPAGAGPPGATSGQAVAPAAAPPGGSGTVPRPEGAPGGAAIPEAAATPGGAGSPGGSRP